MTPRDPDQGNWFGTHVPPGENASVRMSVGESYLGANITIPLHVWRGATSGPTLLITAAVHGDEINGTGVIRHIIREHPFELAAGTLVLAPVVNIMGFERHSRYLPDRRDLNRCFPGSANGSLASRLAHAFFDGGVRRADYCIDLHTAAVRRTNFPNVRADMANPQLAEFARAFGAELIVDGRGPKGSLRISACKIGCQTLILEAGEVWKVEPSVVEYAHRGISNCLKYLGMIPGKLRRPAYRIETDATSWVRATQGGFLQFHVTPGDIVDKGQPIATNTNLVGDEQHVLRAPRDGIILGMTTLPSVAPGDPVCHLAYPTSGVLDKAERAVRKLNEGSLHERLRDDLARSMHTTEHEEQADATD